VGLSLTVSRYESVTYIPGRSHLTIQNPED